MSAGLNILVVGSGGREHAIAWKVAQSPLAQRVYVVPGNGGTADAGSKVQSVSGVDPEDFKALTTFARAHAIDLVIPGQDAFLVDGMTDYFKSKNGAAWMRVFGPSRLAARMEGSKAFAKDFMRRHRIPTGSYETFTDYEMAKRHLDIIYQDQTSKGVKIVLKASGLAAGKGVILPESYEEAVATLKSMMHHKQFGPAGDTVVIEEYLEGEEISILSFSDGYTIRSMPAAQDHKRINDQDHGPNTGGMGAYAPAAVATPEIMAEIQENVLQPTVDGMRNEGYPFVGCLFTGYMLTKAGPKLLEYNVRFGDPECQTLLPLLDTDLVKIMLACCDGSLSRFSLNFKPMFSTTVVAAAAGYPQPYAKGTPMTIDSPSNEHILHFHAGTRLDPNTSTFSTNGGRVIASTAFGPTVQASRDLAYQGMSLIHFDGMHFRRDIASRELARQSQIAQQTAPAAAPAAETPLTYASTGVSIASGNTLVQRIKPSVALTARPGSTATIGGFGGEISLSQANPSYPQNSPTIIAAIDGIGTKLLLALATADYSTIGIDLVAMNVNDLVVQGAEPLAFLDYYACGRLDVDAAVEFVRGVAEGCVRAGCALVGGETAEMPGLYGVKRGEDGIERSDFDAAGCAIGAVAHGKRVLPDREAMLPGDVLVGLGSSGVHSNGFSLVRKIIEREGLKVGDRAPWEENGSSVSVGKALLEPTRIYVKPLLEVLGRFEGAIKGMAHVTGGGLIENIPRMLPKHLRARVEVGSWPVLPVLRWLKRKGGLANEEFATTFNTGLGMVLAVRADDAEDVVKELSRLGENVYTVGSLVERGTGPPIELEGLQKWDAL